jgi:transposase
MDAVEPMFLPAKRGGNNRHVDVREGMNGIMDILRPGCPWRAIPKDPPPRRTRLDYRDLGRYDGTLDRIHPAPYTECREPGGQASPSPFLRQLYFDIPKRLSGGF